MEPSNAFSDSMLCGGILKVLFLFCDMLLLYHASGKWWNFKKRGKRGEIVDKKETHFNGSLGLIFVIYSNLQKVWTRKNAENRKALVFQ